MRLSPRVDRVAGPGADAWSVHREAVRLREAGCDPIVLTVGDPDQPTPAPVVDATVAALRRGRKGYAPILGEPRVRAAIAARMQRRTGQPCTADNVTIVPGAQGGLYCALQCVAAEGDEVIVLDPVYATYPGVIAAAGASMVPVALRADAGFHPDAEAIAAAVTARTRAIWLNSPHNPTGAVFTADEMTAIAEICRRRDLWLISDEVYEDLAFARPHVSAWSLPEMGERAIIVSSLSKSHAMPGFRFGWIIGPAELSRPLFGLLLAMFYGAPPFIQDGALAALERDLPEPSGLREDYRRRAAMLAAMLAEAPHCRVVAPEGGMFVLLDIRATGLGAGEFAHALLAREAVALLPCDGFGCGAVGHLRIALSVEDARLEEAGLRILRFARDLAVRRSG